MTTLPDWRFLLRHSAHFLAFGFSSGITLCWRKTFTLKGTRTYTETSHCYVE